MTEPCPLCGKRIKPITAGPIKNAHNAEENGTKREED
jgi:hypothetical protein